MNVARFALPVALLLMLTHCGDDDAMEDGGIDDASMMDGGPGDTDGGLDATVVEDGGPDVRDADTDAGPPDVSEELRSIREAAFGTHSPALPVSGAIVTYVRDEPVGDDPAGFFVQAETTGPAIFVGIAPSELEPSPRAGDTVAFSVRRTSETSEQIRVREVADWRRLSEGADVTALVQDLSSVADADMVERYESEVVTARGVLVGDDLPGGAAHARYRFATGEVDSERLQFRLSSALLRASYLEAGCTVRIGPSPMWRFSSSSQLMAYEAAHLDVQSCPAPRVVAASASSPTSVTVRFSRPLDPATVQPSDFSFAGGALTTSAAVVEGDRVVLTTSAQTHDQLYTVIVAGVSDIHGGAIGSANTADLRGLGAGAASLVITEYLESIVANRALEITNLGTATATLTGCQILLYANGNLTPVVTRYNFPAGTLAAGESFVICHPTAPAPILERCDDNAGTAALSYNGNDAIELRCGDAVVDSFGRVGENPGDEGWTSGGVSTHRQTLRRQCGVAVGDRVSNDAFDPALEWDAVGLNVFDGLGVHCP